MSLYEPSPSYYRDTVPYTSSDIGEPVPGWGTTVRIAGPARVGIGAATVSKFQMAPVLRMVKLDWKDVSPDAATAQADADADADEGENGEEDKPLPWWIFPTVAMVALGGVGWYGTKKGWF